MAADSLLSHFNRNQSVVPITPAVREQATDRLKKFGKSLVLAPVFSTPEEFLFYNMPEGCPTSLKSRKELHFFP
jgi:hypothetical protein